MYANPNELNAKLRERRKQGLTTDVTDTEEDQSDEEGKPACRLQLITVFLICIPILLSLLSHHCRFGDTLLGLVAPNFASTKVFFSSLQLCL